MSNKKTSYPKQDIRVLLLEGVSRTAVETFRAAGYTQIEFHEKSLPEDELKRRIAEAHIVGIRSRTHLTDDVLAQAREKLKSYKIVEGNEGLPLGTMTDARWKTFFDVAAAQGVYSKTLDPKKAYTLEFLAK